MTYDKIMKVKHLADEIEDYATLCWRAGDIKECEIHDKWAKELRTLIEEIK